MLNDHPVCRPRPADFPASRDANPAGARQRMSGQGDCFSSNRACFKPTIQGG